MTSQPSHSSHDAPPADSVDVLMTVYHRIDPSDLTWALASIHQQTLQPAHTVIVLDGPVGEKLRGVVEQYKKLHDTTVIVELPENQGSAIASNAGLEHCASTWVARLDADDIARPDRLEKQLDYLREHPEIDALGTALAEFTDHDLPVAAPGDFTVDLGAVATIAHSTRALPETNEEIHKAVAWNSPINHPASILRTSALRELGGYRHVPFMEDYDLWARLVAGGYTLHNLPEGLTYFRTSEAMFDRRTGTDMWRAEKQLQANLFHYGLISRPRAIFNLLFRSLYRSLPRPMLRLVYRVLFQR